ncbi:MAG: sulfite exporter TauE/SafE family protein [Rhodoferax sp.]|nr:sulfite exporter TauE/SafE family protein [Rhodoferax sp.]
MSTSLAATALLMGLVGGPHCAAMCGAACAGITRWSAQSGTRAAWRSMGAFQAGRVAGYAGAGAAAAFSVQNFAALADHTAALRPLWTLFHLAVLAWGLMMLAQARQPQWVSAAGRATWARIRPFAAARGGVFATGVLWAFMPCGLLYSALLVASLSGGPLEGAVSMALFALGGSAALTLAPQLFARLRDGWGARAAGGMLALVAAAALWVDTAHRIAAWCATL